MHIMKYYFLGSLIPLTILVLHSLKNYSNAFFPIYLFIYFFHLSGRPYSLGVINWHRAQRMAEMVLLMNFHSLYLSFIMLGVLTLVYKNIHLASLYALVLAFAGKNPLLSILLLFVIVLHDIPFHQTSFLLFSHKNGKEFSFVSNPLDGFLFILEFSFLYIDYSWNILFNPRSHNKLYGIF